MHPFLNSGSKIAALLLGWLTLTLSICALLTSTSSFTFSQCTLVFVPLYFIFLLFIIPNYYVCITLPLGQTSWLNLIASHVLALLIIVGFWLFIGEIYAAFLDAILEQNTYASLFDQSYYVNMTIVIIQFEALVLIHYLYVALERTRDVERSAMQQKLLISQAELSALKATVHPHFLFNALNTLSNIALSSPETAHRFCLLISEFLRYSVAYSKQSETTLADELEHVQNYLGIERERFGDRLKTRFSIDNSLCDTKVPPLILFPIVENALKHGIDSCIEGGLLELVVRAGENTLIIEVTNPVDELGRKLKGTGSGLTSAEHRLRVHYGSLARLKTLRESGQYKVQIYIPLDVELELDAK